MNQKQIAAKLYRECQAWKNCLREGFHCEIYYTPESDKITFSGALTQNSWTENPERIGILHYYTPSKCVEYAEQLMSTINKEQQAIHSIRIAVSKTPDVRWNGSKV